MDKFLKALFYSCTSLVLISCSSKLQVESQTISISSDPVGAAVYADGTFYSNTPTAVALSKDRDHIITVTMDGHDTCMIPVRLIKDDAKNMQGAVLDGLHTGLFHKDPTWGITSAKEKLEEAEKTGKYSKLEPSFVCLKLLPKERIKNPSE